MVLEKEYSESDRLDMDRKSSDQTIRFNQHSRNLLRRFYDEVIEELY